MDTLVIVSWGYLVSCAEFGYEVWVRDDEEMVRLPKGSDPLYRGRLVELVLCEKHMDIEWGDKWGMFSGVIPCKKCGRLTAERNNWVWFTF
ncbi:MAG: hypothetical protein SVY53_05225 [Chloroflexota bacterium]|nr:hypothetical protein [Chloroflexota bacterium]